jgi:hypothetical protein
MPIGMGAIMTNVSNRNDFSRRVLWGLGLTSVLALASAAQADPISPSGWLSNIPLGAPLPQGAYFVDEAYYLNRSGGDISPGLREVDAAVNIPVLAWSTPVDLLGGHLEVIGFAAELGADVFPTSGPGVAYRSFYNPAGLIGEAWNLGNGFSVSEFVGGFAPVDTPLAAAGLGDYSWSFADLVGLVYNGPDGWAANANFVYTHSFDNIATGYQTHADTADVDFAVVKHIDKWQLAFIGSASTDVSSAYDNDWGAHPFSQVSLGGLVGYTFGTVTTELFATRSVEARNQVLGGYDTRVSGRILIPLWNPPPPAPAVVAKY